MARDVQRSKLYAAENVVRKAIGDKPMTDRISVWAYVEKIERDKWFRRNFGVRRFRVHDGRGAKAAKAWGTSNISLPRWSRSPMVILHEIAHCCAPEGTHHGWEYAATYLKLVAHFLGKDVHEKLRRSFKDHRVRYTAPRKRKPLTEEQRVVLRDRLATLRANRAAAKVPSEKSEISPRLAAALEAMPENGDG